jgi:hypothetical protein
MMSPVFKRHLVKIICSFGALGCFTAAFSWVIGLGIFFALWVLMPPVQEYMN